MNKRNQNKRFRWVPHIIRHDFWRKFFALLFAALVTAAVYSEKRKSSEEKGLLHNVQPSLRLENGFVLRTAPPISLTLSLLGPRTKMMDLKPEDFEIKKSVGKAEYDANKTVRFNAADVRCTHPAGALVQILDVTPKSFTLDLDQIITKELPVQLKQYNGRKLPDGYYVRKMEINGERKTVKVTGPRHLIENIRELTLEEIPLENQVADFTTVAKIRPIPDLQLERTTLPVTVFITRKIQRQFKELSVGVMLPPGRVEVSNVIFPEQKVTVRVEGEQNAVNELLETDLYPYVNLSRLSAGAKHVGVPVKCYVAKNGITVTRITPDKLNDILIQELPQPKK